MTDAIARMLAREEIRELVNQYFDCMWRRDIDAALNLFAPDGELVLVGSPVDESGRLRSGADPQNDRVVRGRTEIAALYAGILTETRPLPFGHNTIVTLLDAEHATGRTHAELRQSTDFSWRGVFTLDDEYVKHDGAWKFARRRLAMLHVASAG